MTKRFDRDGCDKIHMQTLCAMNGLDFNLVSTYSATQLFDTAHELGLGLKDVDELFRRLVFNVCMSNNDDHTKNWSFIMKENGGWGLAPAYDLTYSYSSGNLWMSQHFMAVNGKFKDITREDLLLLANRFCVSEPEACIDRTIAVASEWKDYAQRAGISK